MKELMDRLWPGHERSNDPHSNGNEDESSDGEGSVELSTRSVRDPKPNAQSAAPAKSKASGRAKAGRERDMVGFCSIF
jgi:hypothetical protein